MWCPLYNFAIQFGQNADDVLQSNVSRPRNKYHSNAQFISDSHTLKFNTEEITKYESVALSCVQTWNGMFISWNGFLLTSTELSKNSLKE